MQVMEAPAVAGVQVAAAAVVTQVLVEAVAAMLAPAAAAVVVCFLDCIAIIAPMRTVRMVQAVDPGAGMARAADRAAGPMARAAVPTAGTPRTTVGALAADPAVALFIRRPSTQVPSRSIPLPCKRVA